jgi:hypothetical protein
MMIAAVSAEREVRIQMSNHERKESLKDRLKYVTHNKYTLSADFFHQRVCIGTLCWITGHSANHLNQVRDLDSEIPVDQRQFLNTSARETGSDCCVSWLIAMVKELGCESPVKKGVVYLGSTSLERDIFPMYVDDMRELNNVAISSKFFAKLFRGKFGRHTHTGGDYPYVKCRKCDAGKCAECLQNASDAKRGSVLERKNAKIKQKKHLRIVSEERVVYSGNRSKGMIDRISFGIDATAYFATKCPIPHRLIVNPASIREKVCLFDLLLENSN